MSTQNHAPSSAEHALPTAAAGTSRSAVRHRGQGCDQDHADALRVARFKLIVDD